MQQKFNLNTWVEDNKSHFLPPVCNKMMHQVGQLKLFVVGGPNQRKDYHIEEGEELFYQCKGEMTLGLFESGKFRKQVIHEGELLLLPGNIFHSPWRYENTIGWVIERERVKGEEFDGLRWFVEDDNGENSSKILYERHFYLSNLAVDVAAAINDFKQSIQFKTGRPSVDSLCPLPKVNYNPSINVPPPVNLKQFLVDHNNKLSDGKIVSVFGDDYQLSVNVVGASEDLALGHDHVELWLWQITGQSVVNQIDQGGVSRVLHQDDTLMIDINIKAHITQDKDSRTLCVSMDRTRKKY